MHQTSEPEEPFSQDGTSRYQGIPFFPGKSNRRKHKPTAPTPPSRTYGQVDKGLGGESHGPSIAWIPWFPRLPYINLSFFMPNLLFIHKGDAFELDYADLTKSETIL